MACVEYKVEEIEIERKESGRRKGPVPMPKTFILTNPSLPTPYDPSVGVLERQLLRGEMPA